jgi:hypothetical protein
VRAFFDSSALIKRYVEEPGRDEVLKISSESVCVVSALLPVELRGALRRRAAERTLDARRLPAILDRMDEERNHWELVPVGEEVLAAAERLVGRYPLRTLDAIHVSSAQLVVAAVQLVFVTADARQADVAVTLGIAVRLIA